MHPWNGSGAEKTPKTCCSLLAQLRLLLNPALHADLRIHMAHTLSRRRTTRARRWWPGDATVYQV